MSESLLAEFLRARRELVRPRDVGLPDGAGVRRVPGLRREEVAMLAGISADYYLRLEQGRDRNPSPQVLEALARVLGLDDAATDHLHSLVAAPARRRRRTRPEAVPGGTLRLLDALDLPAFVEGRWFDVLAANAFASALSPNVRPGRNRLRDIFLDPSERELHPDWPELLPRLVAGIRDSARGDADDPRVVELVGELSLASEEFRRLWARHDVHARTGLRIRFAHPQVGELTLDLEKLAIGGADGQTLVIHHAAAGTPDAERLALLGSLVARSTERGPAARPAARQSFVTGE